MRRPYVALAALLLAAPIAGVIPGTERTASADAEVSISVFQESLSPYGEWVTVGDAGPVWRPDPGVVGDDFRPYATNGYWVDTDYGWSFESDYEWGWAPFHYGRWFHHPRYGWVWKPGRTWGPAWVDWRFGGGYVGWAPLPPSGISVVYRSQPRWYFVDAPHFTERRVWTHGVPPSQVRRAYSVTVPSQRPITHGGARWNAGPPPARIAQVQGRPVERMHVEPPRRGQVVRVQAERPTQQQQPTRVIPAQRPGVQPQQPTRVAPAQRPDGPRVQQQPPRAVPAQRPDGQRAQPQPAQPTAPRAVPAQRPDTPRAQQPPRGQPQPQQPARTVPSERPAAPAPTHAAPPPRPQPQQQQQAPRPPAPTRAAPPPRPQPQPQQQQQAPRQAPPQHQGDGKVHDQRH